MKIKQLVLPATAAAIVAGAGVIGTRTVMAQGVRDNQLPIIERLAARFGLDQTEVGQVFEEVRTERQAQRQAEIETRLQEAVDNGQITTEQKQLILDKHQEMGQFQRGQQGNWKELSPGERQAQAEQHRAEIETWCQENGIDVELFHQFGPQGSRGEGMHRQGSRMGSNK